MILSLIIKIVSQLIFFDCRDGYTGEFCSIEIWPISSNTKYIFKESNKVYLPKDYSDKKIECYSDAIKIVARNDKYIGFVKYFQNKFYLIP